MITETKTRKLDSEITVYEISGRLNLGNSLLTIESGIKKLIDQGTRKLIVDLTEVNYIDSSGIGMLVTCAGHMEHSNGRMRVAGASGTVSKAFSIVHMERIMPLHDSIEEASAAFE